ncbi:hypothetical protein ACHRVK_10460 [Flavobacterium plurextorum]|uniref:hypothetical protein n=1 Tax=Flavobacterium plurextorum TaxID=1114867 RepID=UPI0037574AFD
MKDGGVDMPSSVLFVLPDQTFILFSAGINVAQGNWIEESKNKIKLESSAADKSIFSVYAIDNRTSKDSIQFSPSDQIYLYACFLKNEVNETIFQPLFDKNWSCLNRDFQMKIPAKSRLLKLVSPVTSTDFSGDIKFPVTSMVYTFQFSEKFSNYRVFIDANSKIKLSLEIRKENDDYVIQQRDGYHSIITDRNDLSDKIMARMNDALIPWQINDLLRRGVKVEKLVPISEEKIELNKTTENPIFISKCN